MACRDATRHQRRPCRSPAQPSSSLRRRRCSRSLPHRAHWHHHGWRVLDRHGNGRVHRRVRAGHDRVIRGESLGGRPHDLTDASVPSRNRHGCGVRQSLVASRRRRGAEQALGVRVRMRQGRVAGVRSRRPDSTYLKNLTWGIGRCQRSGGCVCSAGGERHAEHAGGSGHEQLAGCLHHVLEPFVTTSRFRAAAITLPARHEVTARTG